MKLNFGKRLVLFLHWLLSLIGCAVLIGICISPQLVADIPELFLRFMSADVVMICGIVLAVLYVLLMVLSVVFIFSRDKKRGDRGFIVVDSSESGRTRIAVGAVEQMIRQAVRCVDGIAEMKSSIINNEDAISINTSVVIAAGVHVPTVTMNIQRTIRSYIELNCGVSVREVSVSVQSLESGEEGGKHNRRKNIPAAIVPQPQAVAAPEAQAPAVKENAEQEAPAADEIVLNLDYAAEESADQAEEQEEPRQESEASE